jgi:hypothetical protein
MGSFRPYNGGIDIFASDVFSANPYLDKINNMDGYRFIDIFFLWIQTQQDKK